MSFSVDLSSISEEEKKYIIEECSVTRKKDQYTSHVSHLRLYSVDKEKKEAILPLRRWKKFYEDFPNYYEQHESLSENISFTGTLRTQYPRDQDIVCKEALKTLNKKHSVLLSLYTGFGKTVVAIWLMVKLKFKSVVICSIKLLHKQWKERIETFSNLKVQIIKYGCPIDKDADVYIVGAKKLGNMSYDDFINVGTVVVDEVDRVCTQTFSVSLHRIRPRFLIGCSATPDRVDGLDKALYLYFPSKFIFREETKNFTVIKYKTTFRPSIRANVRGKLDWTHLQNSLSCNENRHLLVCELIKRYYANHKILVMAKRINEIHAIYTLMKKQGFSVDYVSQNKSSWNAESKILIGTFSKMGIGLDINDRDVTILAGDVKDIRQPEGRIRLSNNLIVDIVDDYPTLENHWIKRKKWYVRRGAIISYEGEKRLIKENKWLLPDMK